MAPATAVLTAMPAVVALGTPELECDWGDGVIDTAAVDELARKAMVAGVTSCA